MKQKCVTKIFKRGLSMGLSFVMALTMLPPMEPKAAVVSEEPTKAGSISATVKSVSVDQPFIQTDGTNDTGGQNFSSPALIVRKAKENDSGQKVDRQKDLIITAAEAKYDSPEKSGAKGIMLSVSTDYGKNWKYSFPMQFADDSATFGNPVLVDDETLNGSDLSGTIYCFANAYPAGVSVDTEGKQPKAGTGYIEIDGTKYLALTSDAGKTGTNPASSGAGYEYYVSNRAENGLYHVKNSGDGLDSDYAIDEWYNLYKKTSGTYEALNINSTSVQQNVFYADSELRVYQASYIMYVTSKDNGATWSSPQILNPVISRTDTEILSLTAGKGLRTSAGRIVIPVDNKASTENGTTSYKEDASRASIFWKGIGDDSENWHRSADIDLGNDWTAAGEIVELSSGYLRMFFRSNKKNITYVDATRNDAGDKFTFGTPVATGTGVTPKAKISALKYSRGVNGESAVMLAMPTGSGFTNGMIDTFVRTDSIPFHRVDGFEVDSTNFSGACMDEMAYGSKIGLIWEDGMGSIRFHIYDTLSVSAESFIPNLEVNLDMQVGETYSRKYSGVSGAYLLPDGAQPEITNKDVVDVKFERGTEEKKMVPALYSCSSAGGNTLKEAYQESPDKIVDISKAEFTFKRVSNSDPDVYIIYSEGEHRYFTFYEEAGTFFTTTLRNYMKVSPVTGSADDFTVQTETETETEGIGNTLMFDLSAKRFDGVKNHAITDTVEGKDSKIKLLKKLNDGEEPDAQPLIAGYKTVKADEKIETGRKYLIAYKVDGESGSVFQNDTVVILYPRNSLRNSSKLVYGTYEATISAKKTITITAKAEGESSVTVNGITYHVKAQNATVVVPQNGKTFIRTDSKEIAEPDSRIATVEIGTRMVKGLFNRDFNTVNTAGIDILQAYKTTRNTDLNLSRAEFVIGDTNISYDDEKYYTIYNKYTKSYLVNANANEGNMGNGSFFGNVSDLEKRVHTFDVSGGVDKTFRIRRYQGRCVYFNIEKMRFDSWRSYDANMEGAQGSFEFEFLRKKAVPSLNDPIPGYERVNEIKPGETYLITKYMYYTIPETQERDLAIIILYADNGLANMSKIYRYVQEDGIWVTAKGKKGDTTTVTVGGIPYTVKIGDPCEHKDTELEIRNIYPTCTKEGRKGNIYCSNCQGLVQLGEESIPTIPHTPSPDEWKVTKELAIENDGEKRQICSVCGELCGETQTVPRTVEYLKGELRKLIAEKEAYKQENYTTDSYAKLTEALQTANNCVNNSSATQNELVTAYTTLRDVVLERKQEVVSVEITFDANGGTFASGQSTAKQSTGQNSKVTKPEEEPTRTGYTFDGWFDAQNGGNEVIFGQDGKSNILFENAKTLYAHWTEKKVKITFDAGGGTFADGRETEEIEINKNEHVSKPSVALRKNGYTFTGWYDKAGTEGKEVIFDTNGKSTGTYDTDTTLYAHWTENTIWITFDANGGKFGEDSTKEVEIRQGGKVNEPENPVRGFDFLGWYDKPELEGSTKIVFSDTTFNTATTLYAHWNINVEITFDAGSGAFAGNEQTKTVKVNQNGTVKKPQEDPSFGSETFYGWYDGEEEEVKFDPETGNSEKTFDTNTTLRAVWSQKTQITFDANGGAFADNTTQKPIAVNESKKVKAPDNPQRKDYTFDGWYDAKTDGTKIVFEKDSENNEISSDTFESEKTLYAHWTEKTKVTFDANGGTFADGRVTKSITVNDDGIVTAPSEKVSKGEETFLGWYDAEEGGNLVDLTTEKFSKSTILYAHWNPKENPPETTTVEITFDANGGKFGDGETTATATIAKDGTVGEKEPAAPTNGDLEFGGWCYETTGTDSGVLDLTTEKFGTDKTLYAYWKEAGGSGEAGETVTITFDANGGEFGDGVKTATATIAKNGTVGEKAPAAPVKNGSVFAGWYDKAEEDGAAVDLAVKTFDTDTSLYAHWTQQGTNVTPEPTPTPGQDQPAPTPTPDQTPVSESEFRTGAIEVIKGITYQVLNADKKTVVVKKGANKKKITIPAKVKIKGVSCKVVEIGKKAFKGKKKLKTITIGKNVTTINKNAFQNCKKLQTIKLKGTVLKKVKAGAFKKTSSKLTVNAPKKIKKSKAKRNKLLKALKKGGNKKVTIK